MFNLTPNENSGDIKMPEILTQVMHCVEPQTILSYLNAIVMCVCKWMNGVLYRYFSNHI